MQILPWNCTFAHWMTPISGSPHQKNPPCFWCPHRMTPFFDEILTPNAPYFRSPVGTCASLSYLSAPPRECDMIFLQLDINYKRSISKRLTMQLIRPNARISFLASQAERFALKKLRFSSWGSAKPRSSHCLTKLEKFSIQISFSFGDFGTVHKHLLGDLMQKGALTIFDPCKKITTNVLHAFLRGWPVIFMAKGGVAETFWGLRGGGMIYLFIFFLCISRPPLTSVCERSLLLVW